MPKPNRRPLARRASVDQDLLAQVLSKTFNPDGSMSPVLQKCIAHFKDRFKEVVKGMEASSLGKASRPKTQTTTSNKGCDVVLEVEWTGPFLDEDVQIWKNMLKPKVYRLLTPTMKSTGFFDLTKDRLLPDIETLSKTPFGEVGAELTLVGNKTLFLTAAMTFHHPADKYVLTEADTAFPDLEFHLSDGTSVRFKSERRSFLARKSEYILGSGNTQMSLVFPKTTEATAQAHLLSEAARGRGMTYDALKTLIKRLGMKPSELKMEDPDESQKADLDRIQIQLGVKVYEHIRAGLNLRTDQLSRPRPERWLSDCSVVMSGTPVFVEVQVDIDPDAFQIMSVRIEGELTEPQYRNLNVRDLVFVYGKRPKEVINAADPQAASKLFDAFREDLDTGIEKFIAGIEHRKERADYLLSRGI